MQFFCCCWKNQSENSKINDMGLVLFLGAGWQGNGRVFCAGGDLRMFYNAQKAAAGNADFVLVQLLLLMFFSLCFSVLDSLSLSQLFWTSASSMLIKEDAALLFEQPLIDFQRESNSHFGLKSQGSFFGALWQMIPPQQRLFTASTGLITMQQHTRSLL